MLFFLVSAYSAKAQPDAFEEIALYLTTSQKAMEKCKRSFNDFDQAVRIRDISSLDMRLKALKADTKNLNNVIYAMERLDGDVWYLPKAKAFTKTVYDIVFLRMDEIVKGMEKHGKTEYLLNKYDIAKTDLELAIKEVTWAEKKLLAKLVYASIAENFCISSMKIAQYALGDFGMMNIGLMERESDKYKVSYIPQDAIEGYIYHNGEGQTAAKFIMARKGHVKSAYSAFNSLLYSVLACDHEEMDITDGVIPVDEVSAQDARYPVFKGRPKDHSIHYAIEVGMKDAIVDEERIWEVYVEYSNLGKP